MRVVVMVCVRVFVYEGGFGGVSRREGGGGARELLVGPAIGRRETKQGNCRQNWHAGVHL